MAETQSINMENMYKDLLKRYHEVRKLNIGLLEEKRELLLRSQDNLQGTRPRRSSSNKDENDGGEFCVQGRSDYVPETNNKGDICFLGEQTSCSCQASQNVKELVQVNHTWQEKYDALRCKTKHLESNLEKQQTQLEQEIEENTKLRKLVDNLSSDLQNLSPEFHQSKKDPRKKSHDQICYTSDDIEALKQQLLAYQEDFENERKDKAKAHNENKILHEKLHQADSKIKTISDEKRRFQLCFGEVSQQKEHLISELRRISTSTLPFSPVHQLPKSDRVSNVLENGGDVIPRSSSLAGPFLIGASPGAFKGAKAYQD